MNCIKQKRKNKNISQVQLALTIGWHVSTLSNYENGIRKGNITDCRAIVSGLNELGVECGLDDVFPPEAA
jgi:putative transcriptional regulator